MMLFFIAFLHVSLKKNVKKKKYKIETGRLFLVFNFCILFRGAWLLY